MQNETSFAWLLQFSLVYISWGGANLCLHGRELKRNVFSGQLLVNAAEGLELVLGSVALLGVEVDLENL